MSPLERSNLCTVTSTLSLNRMNVSLKQLHVFYYKLLSLWVLVNVVQAIKFHPHELQELQQRLCCVPGTLLR